MNKKFDAIIIGSGPAGYVAAIRASQLGLKTAVIENDKLGGICLNWGCIPTKALLKTSELNYSLSKLDQFGITISKTSYDWNKVISRTRKVAGKLSSGVDYLLKKNKVEVIYGFGKISGPGKVIVTQNNDDILFEAPNIIVATGAKSKTLPNLKLQSENIWSYKEAMIPKQIPKKLLIIGAGAIGVEFASFYNDFNCEVVLVELQNKILPSEDQEISDIARKLFEKSGINILTNTKVSNLESNNKGISVLLESSDGKKIKKSFDKCILAIGIEANVENIGLENLNIKLEDGRIKTDECGLTSQPGVFAIGDVTGSPWLAHKASHEGIRCVEYINNPSIKSHGKSVIPACTYSRPQIASVGLSEGDALKNGYKIKIGKFPLKANGKALATESSEGLIKTIFREDSGEIIGAHMIGSDVTELISSFCIAMQLEATEEELMNVIFPHPTISESLHESILNAYGRSIHI